MLIVPHPLYLGPETPHDLSVVVTGASAYERAVVEEIVYGALEGAGFKNVTPPFGEMPVLAVHEEGRQVIDTRTHGISRPVENIETLLDACKATCPQIFNKSINIESHQDLFVELPDREQTSDKCSTDAFLKKALVNEPMPNEGSLDSFLTKAFSEKKRVIIEF